jgi:hypothetical protein
MDEETQIRDKAGVFMAMDMLGEFVDIWIEDSPQCPIRLNLRQTVATVELLRSAYLFLTSRWPDVNDDAHNPDMTGAE